MKFWKKLVLFIIAIISIILSCSRYYIVKSNFLHSIENTSKQNTNHHILEKYMLENNIVQSIQSGEEVNDEKIIEYVKSLSGYMNGNNELIALYTEDHELIYTNIYGIEKIDISSMLNKETEGYCLKDINNNHYMLFFSYWTINGKTIYIVNSYDVNFLYEERDRQLRDILFTDIIILIFSAIVIFIFSKYLTKPIESLNKTTKKIAFGKFNERVKIKSNDEFSELADSFNMMAVKIEKQIKELNLQIKQKNDFINGFTHELKTPMSAIIGYSDLLRLKKCDEDVQKRALDYIYHESKRLENLSYKLMNLMSITSESIELTKINIVDFMQKVKKNIVLVENKIELCMENAIIVADKELLETVIRNLVENSNKANPKDNKIIIKGEKVKAKKYRISVIDKGTGIPEEYIDRVTEDFYMVDKSRSRENGGSGIGLSLVKKILDLHKTKLHIKSQEGVGTTVYFELEEDEMR